ncbi:MAG TPA: pilus assembly PilX N-terminal domain-containing protein [Candidatus Eremiobacteraceae bacterium]|nr:pilus assembly PilX N-terminal domain-containing protein [Candidatus Eremiobacteraceae bacterium]
MASLRSERGSALVIALMAMTMMIALGTALILTTTTESKVTRNFRTASEATYAADAVLEQAVGELVPIPDWNALLGGAARSAFTDGPPTGGRTLADGTVIDLGEAINVANCQKPSACADDDMNRVTDERPWGLNNPRWQPFAWGPLNSLTPTGSVNSPFYCIVMVADDPSECDNNPLVDGGAAVPPCGTSSPLNPGAGVLSLRAEAFGPFSTHKILEATVTRSEGAAGVRMLSWREVR